MMSENYMIMTDDSCDLPISYLQEHGIPFARLSFLLDEKRYWGGDMSEKEFYKLMRSGKMPVTAQINQQEFIDLFTPCLEQGKDILYLAFSSGLSGTCHSAQAAAQELRPQYPDRKLIVIDSLCASMGQGLFVHKVWEQKQAGMSIDEAACYATELIPHVIHYVTVDDLMHLHRGGRVSKTAAVAGSLLGIKPVIRVDNAGKLETIDKKRGRKQALNELVDLMEKSVGDTPNDIAMISHGDCLEDAEYVRDLVKKRMGVKNFLINYIGPVIGSHAGPGTMTLFMIGKKR